jgi:menaquinone-dependent protoporphyrinogen oxidase
MSESVLLAFATSCGSTQEVAEAAADTMRKQGLQVDVKPMRETGSLEGYGSVILGAPLYMFRWHKDARRFLSQNSESLKDKPTAVFALGPFNDEEKEFREARGQLDKELARHPWFSPVAVEVFGGKFDPALLRFPYNVVPGLKRLPVTDIRDWEAIRGWVTGVISKLQRA